MSDKILAGISIIACIVIFIITMHMWIGSAFDNRPADDPFATEQEYDPYGDIPAEELVRGDAEAYK